MPQALAVSVVMDWTWRLDPGAIIFYLELKPESKPEVVEQALDEQLEKVRAHGLTARCFALCAVNIPMATTSLAPRATFVLSRARKSSHSTAQLLAPGWRCW